MGVRLGGGGGGGGGGAGGGAGGVLPARPGGGPAKGFPPPPQRSQPPGQSRPGRFTRARGQASVAVPPAAAPPPRAEEGTENTKKRTFPCFGGSRDGCLWVKRCVSTERGGGALAREKRVTKRIRAGRGWGGWGWDGGGGSGLLPYQRSERTKGAAGWVSWLKTCDRGREWLGT